MVFCFFEVLVFGLDAFRGFLDGLSPKFDGLGCRWLLKYELGAVGIVPFIPPCLLGRLIMQNEGATRHKVMQERILIPFQLTLRQSIDRALPLLRQALLGNPLLELHPKRLSDNILHALHTRYRVGS